MQENRKTKELTSPHTPGYTFRWTARQTAITLDLLALVAAFATAYLLRFEFTIPGNEFWQALVQIPYVVFIQLLMLRALGVYSFVWRYVGMAEMKIFLRAVLLSSLPILAIRLGLPVEYKIWRVPLGIIFTDTILAFGAVLGLRVLRRVLYEQTERKKQTNASRNQDKKSILLIGAGRAGVIAAREVQNASTELQIKGFVDDDPSKQGSVIQGIKVLGSTEDLPRLVHQHNIDHIVVSIAQGTRSDFRRILNICERIPIKVKVIPGLHEILQGKVKVSRIRDMQIEDLLGREPVQLDEEGTRRLLSGKTVMVTGAGGSIGSELARQIARFRPSTLLLVERAEFALFSIDLELRRSFPDLVQVPLIADVSDHLRLEKIFAMYRPEVVLHAAAHKHVPMMECNSAEAAKNNVLATHLLGELAGKFGVEAFVLISTDKAVRPTSVMGASKRVAELAIQDLNRKYDTRYVAVRFGNVIGSAGSVIPIFREQIRQGGPVTVTHPEMVRYFMTIPEAAQLVLQAGALGEGGEIFILDMGEPVRILDLAKEAITLSGLKPFEDIEIAFTGMRPGEKLFEELEITEENMSKTKHPKIFIGKIAAYPEEKMRKGLERLAFLAKQGEEQEIREFFNSFLLEARLGGKRQTETRAARTPQSQGATALALVKG
jgi:FlaA1/EpsC-like NDP-sugar epimerase